jgi:hypothetical protein
MSKITSYHAKYFAYELTKRDLQENGVLEKPVSGPNRIVEDGPKGSDFYGDKW